MAGYKKSDPKAVLDGRDEARQGPRLLKVPGGANGKFISTNIRILPPREDAAKARWYVWANAHFNVGPNHNQTVRCLQDFEQFCPACAEAQQLRREGLEDENDKVRAKAYGLLNVVQLDKTTKKPEGGTVVWRVSPGPLTQLINLIEEEYEDNLCIDDPEEGRNVTIRRTGSGTKDTKWEFRLDQNETALNGGDFDAFIEGMVDLEGVFPRFTESKLLAFVQAKTLPAGHDPFGDDDDDEAVDAEFEEVVEALKSVKTAKAKAAPAPEPAPAPTKKPKRSDADAEAARKALQAKLAEEADEDEEDDGEEDDED